MKKIISADLKDENCKVPPFCVMLNKDMRPQREIEEVKFCLISVDFHFKKGHQYQSKKSKPEH